MNVILCVTNDVITDRRVARIATSLMKIFNSVTVAGRYSRGNTVQPVFPFRVKRFRMIFSGKFMFYAEYNIRLFFYLFFSKADVIVANDLDTLPAAFIAARMRKRRLVYDSHEFFTEVPELTDRPFVRSCWLYIEKLLLPSLTNCYTVSSSIASAYRNIYGINMNVIRNLPYRLAGVKPVPGTSSDGKVIIYQGSLNIGRGLELAIRAVALMNNVRLVIVGTGDIDRDLRQMVREMKLNDRVIFEGRKTPDQLLYYTLKADAGISLEQPQGLNYIYSLPNKLFDYIQAGLPVIVSDLPEMAAVVREYGAGIVTGADDPEKLASEISTFLNNDKLIESIRHNLVKAAEELCWEREEKKLLDIYRSL